MKKLVLMMLTIALLVTMMATPVFAADGASAAVSTATGAPGETVEVVLSISEFNYANSLLIMFNIPEKLTVISGEWLLEGIIQDVNFEKNIATLGLSDAKNLNGNIFKLTVKLPDATSSENYYIDFSVKAKNNDVDTDSAGVTGKVSVHVHRYTSVVTAPTCTEDGYTTYTCNCGETYIGNTVPAAGHTWTDATCTEPKTCSVCGATEGNALGHTWSAATCTVPKTCSVCGATEGNALGHTWSAATCTAPKTCSVCGATEGNALGHDYVDGMCIRCGEVDPDYLVPKLEGVSRIYGNNRVYTSFAIADQLKETLRVEKFETIIVAYGLNFPDALTGSYLAAVKDAPILLTYGAYHIEVIDYIRQNLSSDGMVYMLGGTGVVDTTFENYLVQYGIDYKRLGGADRRITNLMILEEAGCGADQEILVCTGLGFADSLSASSAGLPILLVYGSLTEDQKSFLETSSGKFTIIGGIGAVSEALENELKEYGTVTRLGGKTRYDTSVLVAERFISHPDAVVVAYGMNYPDGLCGGPLAVSLNASLILAADNGYTAADAYVAGIDAGIVIGGTALISDTTAREIFDLAANAVIAVK